MARDTFRSMLRRTWLLVSGALLFGQAFNGQFAQIDVVSIQRK